MTETLEQALSEESFCWAADAIVGRVAGETARARAVLEAARDDGQFAQSLAALLRRQPPMTWQQAVIDFAELRELAPKSCDAALQELAAGPPGDIERAAAIISALRATTVVDDAEPPPLVEHQSEEHQSEEHQSQGPWWDDATTAPAPSALVADPVRLTIGCSALRGDSGRVWLRNNGYAPVTLAGVHLQGSPHLYVCALLRGTTLSSGASIEVTVRLRPSAPPGGAVYGELVVTGGEDPLRVGTLLKVDVAAHAGAWPAMRRV